MGKLKEYSVSGIINLICDALVYFFTNNWLTTIIVLIVIGFLTFLYFKIVKEKNDQIQNLKSENEKHIETIGDANKAIEKLEEQNKMDTVFTVSAILINSDYQLALIQERDEPMLKQPGSKFRKNENSTPFDKIIQTISKETGLSEVDYKMIPLYESETYIVNDIKIGTYVDNNSYYDSEVFKHLRENILSPAPFLIMKQEQKENNESENKFHLDLFYAFKLTDTGKQKIKEIEKGSVIIGVNKTDKVKIKNIKWYKRDSIKNEELIKYKDLTIVYDKFIELYKKTNSPKLKINFCNFSLKEKTLVFRLTSRCNLTCSYCLMDISEKIHRVADPFTVDMNKLKSLLETIENHQINKIVVTGGEPFLATNLFDVVNELSKKSKSISVCTNGTYTENKEILERLFTITNFKKLVVSLDSCGVKDYESMTQKDRFDKVLKFINIVNDVNSNYNKKVQVNVVVDDRNKLFLHQEKVKYFIKTWRDNRINNISISYPMQGALFSKKELKNHCEKICSGDYGDVDFITDFELNLPECKNTCQHESVFFCYEESNSYKFERSCMDKKVFL